MPLPTQYARVAWNFQDPGGKVWQNIYWYELGGTFGPTYNIANAATAVQAHSSTEQLASLSPDVTLLGVDLRINNAGVSGDSSTFPNASGTGTGTEAPNEVAAVVHWQTAQPGGSGRGRSYLSGIPAPFVTGGRLNGTAFTAINALAAKLLLAFTDQGISWGLRLYSRKLGILIPTASFVTDALVGTQRRRRPRR